MTVDSNVSSRINLMRIVLISGIVFVHIPFDVKSSPFNGTYGAFDWFRVFLTEALFRVGVPCLSAISGYLLFRGGLENFSYLKTVRTKSQTVLLPFLIWNGAFFLAILAALALGIGDGYVPDPWHASARDLLTHLFGIEDFPVNVPLYFLRDLFVCILISPLLALLISRVPLITLAALLLLALVPELPLYIVLKRSILFSFSLGIYVGLYNIDLKALDRFAPVGIALLLASSALLATAIYLAGPQVPDWIQLLRNTLAIAGALGFWLLSAPLIKTQIGQRLSKTGSLSFWIFCAHYPLLILLWIVWGKSGIDTYPIFFVLSLALLFPFLAVSNAACRRIAPRLYAILTGGRTKKPTDRTPSAGTIRPELVSQQR
ncbi:acyltransferase [Rhizobium grahamii]|uniref:Acyltransferase n=1 Tax=Rhizobium grahamii TaxID=1120045 RepID=A0A5Q0CAY0_9HYPH|nr:MULTISPECIES: acyltransferase [Rhizobium]QFY61037.1 acyltransferase [Rhizobium grahamii]QRM49812.1 acyltransferase [Rhizobium sp. BG6]